MNGAQGGTNAMEESEIRAVLDRRSEAIGLKDIDRLVSHYSPDAVYFDVVPPLRYSGSAALRRRFSEWLDAYQGAVKQEIHEFSARIGGNL
jgi:ketosteroid isomerase-like protein